MKFSRIFLALLVAAGLAAPVRAQTPISGFPAAGAITGSELVPIVQDGINRRTTISNMVTALGGTSYACGVAKTWVRALVSGVPTCVQPAIGDISGVYPFASGGTGSGVNATASGFSASNQALWLVGTLTASGAAPYALTSVTDTATGSTAVPALAAHWIAHNINNGAGEGSRFSLMPILTKNVAVPGTNAAKKFYTPFFAIHFANAGDGGSSSGPTYYGSYYGMASLLEMRAGATYLKSAQGAEFDISLQTGSSAQYKSAMLIASANSDAVKGSTYEAMLSFGRDATTTATWDRGIDFNWPLGLFPFSSSATLIGSSASGSVAYGVDLSNLTIATSAFKSTGFNVNGSGAATVASLASTGAVSAASGSFSGAATAARLQATASVPTQSNCGTSPSVDAGSSGNGGKFTIGSAATACTLTFASAFPTNAYCTVTPAAQPAAVANIPYVSAQSHTAFTVSGATASTAYFYTCVGN